MSRFIDTTAAVRSHAAGRSQSLAELQNRQGVERAAEQQRMANEELAMRQQQMVLAQQEQARQRMIDEGVANVFREQYSRLLGPSPVAPGGVGPVQPDGLEDFRGSIATAPLPVLRAMGPFISNRAKLNELMKRLPELEKQRSMIAPDSPLRLILDHMIDNVRVGDTEGFEQAARQFVTAQVKAKEGEQKAAENDAVLQQLASDMSAQYGIPMEEAIRRVRLTKGNIINESQNQTGATRGPIASLAREINAPVDGLSLVPGEPREDENGEKWVTVEKGGQQYEIKAAMWPLIQKFGSWENAIAALRQASGKPATMAPSPSGQGLPQTTSTTPAPGAPSGGPISQDDDRAVEVYNQLSQKLGRPPTDDELLAAGVQP